MYIVQARSIDIRFFKKSVCVFVKENTYVLMLFHIYLRFFNIL